MYGLSIVIQAGGQSSRMGQEKGIMPFLGQPLIARILKRLETVGEEILIVTNRPELYEFLNQQMIPDLLPGTGPLGGLLTALHAARLPLVAVAACDLPFVNAGIFEKGRRLLSGDPTLDVLIPRSKAGLEPLHAVYRKSTCLPAVQEALNQEKRRMISWLHAVNVRELTPDAIARLDPHGLAFQNLNTPEEAAEAEIQAKMIEDQSNIQGGN